jgi:acetyltransferase EpsM
MQLLICGAGGFGKELVEMIQTSCSRSQYKDIFLLDSRPELVGQNVIGVPVIGDDSKLKEFDPEITEVCIAIAKPVQRQKLVRFIKDAGFRFASIVDDAALIRPSATLGEGVIIFSHVVVACDARIGDHVVINTNALIGHDTIIGDYSVISPHAVILGDICVGEGIEIGSGAIIHPGITIGEWSKIGMGSIIYKSVTPNVVISGKPSKIVTRKAHDWYKKQV